MLPCRRGGGRPGAPRSKRAARGRRCRRARRRGRPGGDPPFVPVEDPPRRGRKSGKGDGGGGFRGVGETRRGRGDRRSARRGRAVGPGAIRGGRAPGPRHLQPRGGARDPVDSGTGRERGPRGRPRVGRRFRHAVRAGRGDHDGGEGGNVPSPPAGGCRHRIVQRGAQASLRSQGGAARPGGAARDRMGAAPVGCSRRRPVRDRLRPFFPRPDVVCGRDRGPRAVRHLLRGPLRGASTPGRRRVRHPPRNPETGRPRFPRDNLGARRDEPDGDGRGGAADGAGAGRGPHRDRPPARHSFTARRGNAPVRSVPGCGRPRRRFPRGTRS